MFGLYLSGLLIPSLVVLQARRRKMEEEAQAVTGLDSCPDHQVHPERPQMTPDDLTFWVSSVSVFGKRPCCHKTAFGIGTIRNPSGSSLSEVLPVQFWGGHLSSANLCARNSIRFFSMRLPLIELIR